MARIVNVVCVPFPVEAIFLDEGEEIRERVYLIGIYSDGDVRFLTADEDGLFTVPDDMANFRRYEFGKK